MVMDGMEDNSEGIGQQSGTFRLEVFREDGQTGMTFSSGTMPTLLTEAAESAQLTHWRYLRGEAPLTLGSSAAVAVAYAPPEGDSSASTGALNREDLPAVSAAETLAARLWVLRDDPQMELENLLLDEGIPHVEGAASWIPVNHRSISNPAGDTLSFRFDAPSATAQGVQQAMEKKAMVLLALREDLTKVTWKWTPEGTDVPALSRQLTETEADGLLFAAGFSEGVKAMGTSPAALAELLQWLDSWAGASTVEGTAIRLWALSRGSGRYNAVREVVYRGPWAVPEMEGQCSAILNMEEISFQLMFMPSDPAALDAAMERSALVALYLLPWVEEVRWTYPGPDGAVERRVYGWEPKGEADLAALSAASGYDLARFHQSEEGLAVLLAALAKADTPAVMAQLLYARARIQTAEEMAEELVLRGPWGDSSLAGTLHASRANGRLILQFTREGAWEQAMQQEQLARSGVVLLALYPDLQEVRAWSADGESYTWMTRETAAQSLPEGMEIGDYGASPETLEELLTALERLYRGTDYAA